jgi:hypothetical protein
LDFINMVLQEFLWLSPSTVFHKDPLIWLWNQLMGLHAAQVGKKAKR